MLSKIAVAASIAASFVFAGAAFGGKPSPSSITGPYLVTTSAPSAPVGAATVTPQFGDTITFNISTAQTGNPFVNLVCSGVGVGYDSWAAFWPNSESFILSSPAWTSGAADCTANLVMYVNGAKYKVLASTRFHVDA